MELRCRSREQPAVVAHRVGRQLRPLGHQEAEDVPRGRRRVRFDQGQVRRVDRRIGPRGCDRHHCSDRPVHHGRQLAGIGQEPRCPISIERPGEPPGEQHLRVERRAEGEGGSRGLEQPGEGRPSHVHGDRRTIQDLTRQLRQSAAGTHLDPQVHAIGRGSQRVGEAHGRGDLGEQQRAQVVARGEQAARDGRGHGPGEGPHGKRRQLSGESFGGTRHQGRVEGVGDPQPVDGQPPVPGPLRRRRPRPRRGRRSPSAAARCRRR